MVYEQTDHGRPPTQLYIGGAWHDSEDGIEVRDLTDGTTFATVAAARHGQAKSAVESAVGAQRQMRESTIPERAEWLSAIAEGIADRTAALSETIVREAGKPIPSARSEVDSAAERFRRAVEEARNVEGSYREGTTAGHEGWKALVRPEPVGTVLCISPYNYPLATAALQVAPALAAGNSVVLKPASNTPVSAAMLAEVVDEVGLPDGAVNLVTGRGSEVGDALAGDERIDAIAMTGSSGAGKHIARESEMVELHMELGGNAPLVVFPDADLDEAAAAAAKGSLKYAGQRCSAVSRVLAHDSVHDELADRIDAAMGEWNRGDLFEESTDIGPLIDADHADWVEQLVDDASERGAEVVRGGDRDGTWFEPTVLADVPREADIVTDEQFGPVCPVIPVEDETEAIEVANSGDLALDASVFTSDYDRAMTMADRIDAGAVRINGAPSHGLADIPYGGNEDSGIGREGLGVTIESFLTTKTIVL
ncbi:aldehyde dehydrogenase family protein [Haloarcula sp. S1CR25-12]|uniref:Aldehyde dehydrogenase family protein n=1 Tax=Haloarcula saliterrae TaxID=2950534 RepID=A0ABU2FGR4_9EURY|nr:aldehyde dehydrogenase family protein [Haloarcula sp. S1CR25-12]MDS0260900.1 aldehyde dehydrogenase family protein [Haloarcula sp. S1CR25-12]